MNNNDKIYVIEKAWYDMFENYNDFGYNVHAFVETEEEAKDIVNNGGELEGRPLYLYKEVRRFK